MMATVQSKGFPLAGLLTNVNPQNLIKPKVVNDYLLSIVMAKGLAKLSLNLTKPDIHARGMTTNDDILNQEKITSKKLTVGNKILLLTGSVNWRATVMGRVTSAFASSTHAPEDFLGVVTREGEYSESIKKGSHKATHCNVAEKNQALGLIPSFRSLSRHESLTQELKLPCPATALICSSSSSSKRMCFMVLPLRSNAFFCLSSCIGSYQYYNGNTDGNYQLAVIQYRSVKTAKPEGALTPIGLLTTTDSNSIEVAMSNRTTHPQGRDSYTLKKFTWCFLAINHHDKKAKPCRLSVGAETEREARRILAPHFILSLSARLHVLEISA